MKSALLQKLAIRIDTLQLRERALLLVAGVVLMFLISDSLGFQPIYREKQLLLQNIEAQELQLDELHQRSSLLDQGFRDEQPELLEQHREELLISGVDLKSRLADFLAPDRAVEILKEVLRQENGLTLKSLNTRQVSIDTLQGQPANGLTNSDITRFELELQFEGGYLETLDYLRALEALRWKFLWTAITFVVTDYPKASVDLEIYTLGTSGV